MIFGRDVPILGIGLSYGVWVNLGIQLGMLSGWGVGYIWDDINCRWFCLRVGMDVRERPCAWSGRVVVIGAIIMIPGTGSLILASTIVLISDWGGRVPRSEQGRS